MHSLTTTMRIYFFRSSFLPFLAVFCFCFFFLIKKNRKHLKATDSADCPSNLFEARHNESKGNGRERMQIPHLSVTSFHCRDKVKINDGEKKNKTTPKKYNCCKVSPSEAIRFKHQGEQSIKQHG